VDFMEVLPGRKGVKEQGTSLREIRLPII
jgi:hypothetical protein